MMSLFKVLLCFFMSVNFTKCNDGSLFNAYNYPQVVQVTNPSFRKTPQASGFTAASSYDVERSLANAIINTTLKIQRSSEFANLDYVVLGPVTIVGALSVMLLGSIGKTETELNNFLELSTIPQSNTDKTTVTEYMGNFLRKLVTRDAVNEGVIEYGISIFYQQDFEIRPEFRDITTRFYQADLIEVDFRSHSLEAQHTINDWVFNRTRGKITKIFYSPPAISTNVIITSVLYFKADWKYPFLEGYTNVKPFYSNGRNQPSDKNVLMMTNAGEFPYIRLDNLEMIGLPYKGDRVTMYIIISDYATKQNISSLKESLNLRTLNYCIEKATPTDAIVLLPKMTLETSINLRSTLENAGVRSLFNPKESNLGLMTSGKLSMSPPQTTSRSTLINRPYQGLHQLKDTIKKTSIFPNYDANRNENDERRYSQPPLSNVNAHENLDSLAKLKNLGKELSNSRSNPGLYVDNVIHKVYIDINEKGTEAAAATGTSLNKSGDRLRFKVDIPFVFFMYDNHLKSILFWGSVKSPPGVRQT